MIREFQGEYRWLSNFAPVRIVLAGRAYASVEHAYMSAKSDDEAWKDKCAGNATAGEIKRASRNIKLVDGWNEKKVDVMSDCILQKFMQEPYRAKLLATGDEHLQEGNRWGDRFWGIDLRSNTGDNRLGKMIMAVREYLARP